MKSVIVRDLRGEGGRVTENAELLRFAVHWGFRPRAFRVTIERRPVAEYDRLAAGVS